MQLTTDYSVSK